MSDSQSDINGHFEQTCDEENKMLHIVWAAADWLVGGPSYNFNKEKNILKISRA